MDFALLGGAGQINGLQCVCVSLTLGLAEGEHNTGRELLRLQELQQCKVDAAVAGLLRVPSVPALVVVAAYVTRKSDKA